MKKIVIYVSDHGYGHATRIIALVRSLLKLKNFEIIIKNHNAFSFLKSSLPNVKIQKIKTDVGPIYDWAKNRINIEQSIRYYLDFIKQEKLWLEKEEHFINKHKPALIISDISPIALKLGNKTNSYSVCITNFTWIDIWKHFPQTKETERIMKWLKNAFLSVDTAIELPFATQLEGLSKTKKSSILCRDTNFTLSSIKKKLHIKAPTVLITFGGNIPPNLKIRKADPSVDVFLLSPFNARISGIRTLNSRLESHNVIFASDHVIAKGGYGIISECVKFRRCVSLIKRKNYHEDTILLQKAKTLGIARRLIYEDIKPLEIPTRDEIKERNSEIQEEKIHNLEKLPAAHNIINELI